MDTLSGRLLVATPAIEAGPFLRSVVLLLDHDDDGALGVILNHPLDADVADVLPAWGSVVNAPDCLFEGGPVSTDSALAVGVRAPAAPEASAALEWWQPMTGRVGLVDLDGPPPEPGILRGLRVFAGYAGWGPGQLEGELDEGAWLAVDALDDDVLSPVPEQLWREVLRRQGDDLRFWATFPEDPTVN